MRHITKEQRRKIFLGKRIIQRGAQRGKLIPRHIQNTPGRNQCGKCGTNDAYWLCKVNGKLIGLCWGCRAKNEVGLFDEDIGEH